MRRTWVRGHYRSVGKRRNKPKSMMIAWICLCFILTILYFLIMYPAMVVLIAIVLLIFAIGIKVFRWRQSRHAIISHVRDTRYIPDQMRQHILARDGYRCQYCGSQSYLEMDHIIPLSKGGATSLKNLQTLCHGCNMKKGNR